MMDNEDQKNLKGMDLFNGLELSQDEIQGFFKTARLLIEQPKTHSDMLGKSIITEDEHLDIVNNLAKSMGTRQLVANESGQKIKVGKGELDYSEKTLLETMTNIYLQTTPSRGGVGRSQLVSSLTGNPWDWVKGKASQIKGKILGRDQQ